MQISHHPVWPNPTPGDHNSNNLISALQEDAFTQVKTVLAKWKIFNCIFLYIFCIFLCKKRLYSRDHDFIKGLLHLRTFDMCNCRTGQYLNCKFT